jgi:hypothetical protein
LKLQREPQSVLRAITGNETEHGINGKEIWGQPDQKIQAPHVGLKTQDFCKHFQKWRYCETHCIRLEGNF